MRIVVNDVAASSGGALTILKSFYNYLQLNESSKEHEWIFLLSDYYLEETENIKVIVLEKVKKNWNKRLIFDLINGCHFLKRLNPDVIFSLQNTITFGVKCPQVLYVHQSIPFQTVKKFSFIKSEEKHLAFYQHFIGRMIKASIRKANFVIVQTQWIKDAVLKTTNISPNKIINVLPPHEDYTKYKKKGLFKQNSFFYPGTASVYKNHKCLYEATEILRSKGVFNFEVNLTIDGKPYNANINNLGRLQFKEVLRRYNVSTLIFPSYIETIGLPLLEARQMGTVILASDCPFSREVLKGYVNAYFFNPFNPNELASLMEQVIIGEITKSDKLDANTISKNSWESVVAIIEKARISN